MPFLRRAILIVFFTASYTIAVWFIGWPYGERWMGALVASLSIISTELVVYKSEKEGSE